MPNRIEVSSEFHAERGVGVREGTIAGTVIPMYIGIGIHRDAPTTPGPSDRTRKNGHAPAPVFGLPALLGRGYNTRVERRGGMGPI